MARQIRRPGTTAKFHQLISGRRIWARFEFFINFCATIGTCRNYMYPKESGPEI